MPATLQDRLKDIEEQKKEALAEVDAKKAEREAAKDAFAGKDTADINSPEFQAAKEAQKAFGEALERLEQLKDGELTVLKMLGRDPEIARPVDKGGRDSDDPGDGEWRAKALLDNDQIRETFERAASSAKSHLGQVHLGEVASRDTLKADITGTTSMRRGDFAGIVPQIRRRIRLLDLISIGTTNGNSVPYTQGGGSYAAAETTEAATKPESGATFTDQNAPVQTIAAWQKVPKQVLADVDALQSIIDNRLRYEVLRRLEGQVLSGDGVSPNLAGITATSGIGTVATAAGRAYGEGVLAGITQVMLAEGEPTAVVVNPSDYQTILTTKASGSGEYLNEVEPLAGPGLGNVGGAGVAVPSLWGVPLVVSTVLAAGHAVVGDFQLGAQLFIRDGVNVLVSDADGTDFTKNRVTILAEMRAALAVWLPALFSYVTY